MICMQCAELTLLTRLPWRHTEFTYDTIGEAVLEQTHPATAEKFCCTKPKQEITNNPDVLHLHAMLFRVL